MPLGSFCHQVSETAHGCEVGGWLPEVNVTRVENDNVDKILAKGCTFASLRATSYDDVFARTTVPTSFAVGPDDLDAIATTAMANIRLSMRQTIENQLEAAVSESISDPQKWQTSRNLNVSATDDAPYYYLLLVAKPYDASLPWSLACTHIPALDCLPNPTNCSRMRSDSAEMFDPVVNEIKATFGRTCVIFPSECGCTSMGGQGVRYSAYMTIVVPTLSKQDEMFQSCSEYKEALRPILVLQCAAFPLAATPNGAVLESHFRGSYAEMLRSGLRSSWNASASFTDFFALCNPTKCTWIEDRTRGLLETLVLLCGLGGGIYSTIHSVISVGLDRWDKQRSNKTPLGASKNSEKLHELSAKSSMEMEAVSGLQSLANWSV
eukprot:CAMPEP_0175119868 /NCGR_PEP_ID=MMETSP0087-20121206/307_1 /TAXON_ID=136419 /ORGANISM="Unknown Unknown, Strain D1" /LENGTH=378 /DNA_ID=CAMNT_0016401257 /DNA_START=272 /DNA_END=1408 /DNA_ORIENTATION=+